MRQSYFVCCKCHEAIDCTPEGYFTPGYGSNRDGSEKTCYACIAKDEAAEMLATGKGFLYINEKTREVSNWPGSLKFHVNRISRSFHNFAGKDGRVDFWFRGLGRDWHGVCIGDQQFSRVYALKVRV